MKTHRRFSALSPRPTRFSALPALPALPIAGRSLLRRFRALAIVSATLLTAGGLHGQGAVRYRFTDLGNVYGSDFITATGINDFGVIVGWGYNEASEFRAFRTAGERLSPANDLGTLGGVSSQAFGINNSGVIVGVSQVADPDNPFQHAFSTTGTLSAANDLGILPGDGQGFSRAVGINNAGVITGISEARAGSNISNSAFRTTGPLAGGEELGAFVNEFGYSSSGFAINDLGVVVGFATTSRGEDGTVSQPFRSDGPLSSNGLALGSLGGRAGIAYDINNDGVIVGFSDLNDDVYHAFRTTGVMTAASDLGTLGGPRSAALGINNAGLIVGTSDILFNEGAGTVGFVWRNGVMTNLNSLVVGNSLGTGAIPENGYIIVSANAINNRGAIVGYGYNYATASSSIYVLTPVTDSYWTGTASRNWSGDANWNTDVADQMPGLAPEADSNVFFATSTPLGTNLDTVLDRPFEINSLTFLNTATSTVTIGNGGNANNTLTIGGGGLSVDDNSAAHRITARVILGDNQVWSVGAGAGILVVNGEVGDSGSNRSLTKAGPGTLMLTGAITYTGGTIVNSGVLAYDSATAASGSFVTNGGGTAGSQGGYLRFLNASSAGTGVFANNGSNISSATGGKTEFLNDAKAGSGTFTNTGGTVPNGGGGFVNFFNNSSAENGTFTNHGGTLSGAFGGKTQFVDASSAGNGKFINNSGTVAGVENGFTQFFNTSSGGTGTFTNNGSGVISATGGKTDFHDQSRAGSGTFTNTGGTAGAGGGGFTNFFDASSAENGTFTNTGGTVAGAFGGKTQLIDQSSAGSGKFINNGGGVVGAENGFTQFFNTASGGTGTFTNNGSGISSVTGGKTDFHDQSRAGSGTFTNTGGTASIGGGGFTNFFDASSAENGTFTTFGGTVAGAFGGKTQFVDQSSAGSGKFINNGGTVAEVENGFTQFFNTSSGGTGTFTNNGSGVTGATGGKTEFLNTSRAGSGAFTNTGGTASGGGGGFTNFRENSSAENGTFTTFGGTVTGAFGGKTEFIDISSAGSGKFINNGGTITGAENGYTRFFNTTSGGTGTFINNGSDVTGATGGKTEFFDQSKAGSGTFTNTGGTASGGGGGFVNFLGNSSAENGMFTTFGGTVSGAFGGKTEFIDTSTAGSGKFINNGAGVVGAENGYTKFFNGTTGGTGTFTNNGSAVGGATGGKTEFLNESKAGSGAFTNNGGTVNGGGGGFVNFRDDASAENGTFTTFGGTASGAFGGKTEFIDGSNAGTGKFINNGGTVAGAENGFTKFFNTTSAATGTFTNNGSAVSGATGGKTEFHSDARAGTGAFTNKGGTVNGGGGGFTNFLDNASAENGTFITFGGTVSGAFGGKTEFTGNATAGNGKFINNSGAVSGAENGFTKFFANSTAASGTFTNNGSAVGGANGGHTEFLGASRANNGTFANHGGAVNGATGGFTVFGGTSSAETALFTNNGGEVSGAGGGFTRFNGNATAGNATFTVNGGAVRGAFGGKVQFRENSKAGNAVLTVNGGDGQGGGILFLDNSSGESARVELLGNGYLDISDHSGPGVSIGSLKGSGDVFLGDNTLATGGDNLSTDFTGVIRDGASDGGKGEGGGLTKAGAGVLTLAGISTYTGNTAVNSGTLALTGNGSIDQSARIVLAAAGTLNVSGRDGGRYAFDNTITGSGRIVGNLVNNGVVIPGSPAAGRATPTANRLRGNLTVQGDYTQTGNGTLVIAMHNDGTVNSLIVTGTATLGGTLRLKPDSGTLATGTYSIVQAGAIVGKFSTVVQDVDGRQVALDQILRGNTLSITTASVTSVSEWAAVIAGLRGNARGIATYLNDNRNRGDSELTAIMADLDASSAREIYDFLGSFDPSEYARQRVQQIKQMQNLFLTERLGSLRGPAPQGDKASLDKTPVPVQAREAMPEDRLQLWTSARGSVMEGGNSSDFNGGDSGSIGGMVGLDYRVSDKLTLGGFIGYENSENDSGGSRGKLESDYVTIGAYGTVGYDTGWYGSGLAMVGFGSNDSHRRLELPGGDVTARSDYDSTAWLGRLSTGYQFSAGSWKFGPSAHIEYSGVNTDGFGEEGAGGLNLRVAEDTLESLRTLIGLNAHGENDLGGRKLRTRLGLYWAHEYLGQDNDVTASLAGLGGGNFKVSGPRLGSDSIIATAAVGIDLTSRTNLSLDYQYQRDFDSDESNQHYFGVTLGVKF